MSHLDTEVEHDNDMHQEERYIEDREMCVGYYKPVDIFSFLRSFDDVKGFFTLLFDEHIRCAKYIDEHGNKVFYPIIYIEKIFYYGVDYQFFIFVLAKFVSNKMNGDEFIFRRVIKDYAILTFNVGSSICKSNRKMLMSFFGEQCFAINNGNYTRACKYFETDVPRLIKFDDKIVLHKSVVFNRKGLERYINVPDIIAKNKRYFKEESYDVVSWGKMNIGKYLKKNNIVKYNYFTLKMTREESGDLTFEESYETFCK